MGKYQICILKGSSNCSVEVTGEVRLKLRNQLGGPCDRKLLGYELGSGNGHGKEKTFDRNI